MSAPFLDQAILKTLLHYAPETGVFTWKRRTDVREQWNGRYAGKVAGYDWRVNDKLVYRSIRIFDWPFLGHRLAVLYVTGEWPPHEVDHEDLDGLNNRWSNLRPATKPQNGANRGANANSKTGVKGVRLLACGKYDANFRNQRVGTAATVQEASALYEAAAKAHFGKFARAS